MTLEEFPESEGGLGGLSAHGGNQAGNLVGGQFAGQIVGAVPKRHDRQAPRIGRRDFDVQLEVVQCGDDRFRRFGVRHGLIAEQQIHPQHGHDNNPEEHADHDDPGGLDVIAQLALGWGKTHNPIIDPRGGRDEGRNQWPVARNQRSEVRSQRSVNPPKTGRDQLGEILVRIAEIEAHRAGGPVDGAFDLDAHRLQVLLPVRKLVGGDGESEVASPF